jgi:hypothetical protein
MGHRLDDGVFNRSGLNAEIGVHYPYPRKIRIWKIGMVDEVLHDGDE